jgi:tripartite-type tricarboxylate transporter receptor subunit TctC
MFKFETALAAAALAVVMAAPASAQTYPDRNVEFIVPFTPGGGADASQRAFNKYAEPLTGKALPITNKPGAGGATGWAELTRAKPDGYTLTITAPPFNIIPPLVKPKQTGYTLDQFTHICVYAVVPDVLLVRNDSPFKTFADLVKFAKENPKKIKAANSGTLGADFMTTLLIENAAGIELTQIPFNSGSLALQGVLAGTTDVFVASTLFAVTQKDSLRTLGIAAGARDPQIPDVPTFKEMGFDVLSERLRVLSGPAGLPADVVSYWADICKKVSADTAFRDEMTKLGQPAAFYGPDEAKKLVDAMTDDMKGIVDKYKLAEQ